MSNNNLQNQNNRDDRGENHPDILKLFSRASEVSLTPEEKLKGTLLFENFINKNPLSGTQINKVSKTTVKTWEIFYTTYLKGIFIKNHRLAYMLAVTIFIFSLATSAVYAAQDSIPGELLYPVKIQINERVERVLARSTENKARVAVKQAVTRLEETKKLLEQGKIDSKSEKTIYKGFVHNSNDVEKNIAKLRKEGRFDIAVKISSDFESKIDSEDQNIGQALENAPKQIKDEMTATRVYIRKSIDISASGRIDLENKLNNKKHKKEESMNEEHKGKSKGKSKSNNANRFIMNTSSTSVSSVDTDTSVTTTVPTVTISNSLLSSSTIGTTTSSSVSSIIATTTQTITTEVIIAPTTVNQTPVLSPSIPPVPSLPVPTL